MKLGVSSLVAACSVFLAAMPALAGDCGQKGVPSRNGGEATEILFHNFSDHVAQVYWSDLNGRLKQYAKIKPDDIVTFKTNIGHYWYIEAITTRDEAARRQGEGCFGPISAAYSDSACTARILYDDGIGIDAGGCDYE